MRSFPPLCRIHTTSNPRKSCTKKNLSQMLDLRLHLSSLLADQLNQIFHRLIFGVALFCLFFSFPSLFLSLFNLSQRSPTSLFLSSKERKEERNIPRSTRDKTQNENENKKKRTPQALFLSECLKSNG